MLYSKENHNLYRENRVTTRINVMTEVDERRKEFIDTAYFVHNRDEQETINKNDLQEFCTTARRTGAPGGIRLTSTAVCGPPLNVREAL